MVVSAWYGSRGAPAADPSCARARDGGHGAPPEPSGAGFWWDAEGEDGRFEQPYAQPVAAVVVHTKPRADPRGAAYADPGPAPRAHPARTSVSPGRRLSRLSRK